MLSGTICKSLARGAGQWLPHRGENRLWGQKKKREVTQNRHGKQIAWQDMGEVETGVHNFLHLDLDSDKFCELVPQINSHSLLS